MENTDFSVEENYLIPSYTKLPMSIEKGEGLYVWDQNGNKYLDLYGGHAVVLTGHCHPRLIHALNEQASKLFFYSSVAYSQARAQAAKDLIEFVGGDRRVFFSNSGAEANENALKIARMATGRSSVISFEGSFHGRTLGAISVTGISKYRTEINDNVRFSKWNDIKNFESKLDSTIGAVIIEPIQSLWGCREASKDFFTAITRLCAQNGTLVIFDEIQTGLGRCGDAMYFRSLEIDPDIVTLAKGLAGGFPAGATLAKREVVDKLKVGDLGSTFGGGPLASKLISETISVIQDEKLVQNANVRGRQLQDQLQNIPGVLEVRGSGLLIGIKTRKSASELVKKFIDHRILIGSSLDPEVIRLLPPLTVTESAINQFISTLKEIL